MRSLLSLKLLPDMCTHPWIVDELITYSVVCSPVGIWVFDYLHATVYLLLDVIHALDMTARCVDSY
jgi:hypothetical protein